MDSMIRLQLSKSAVNVASGDANWYGFFHSIQIRNCQNASTIAMASNFGHAAFQIRAPRETRGAIGTSSASRPDVSARSSTAMTTHFLLQAIRDRARLFRNLGRIEATRPGDVDRVLLDDAPGAARQQDHPVTE